MMDKPVRIIAFAMLTTLLVAFNSCDGGLEPLSGHDQNHTERNLDNSLQSVLSKIPELVLCANVSDPFAAFTETTYDSTHYYGCTEVCAGPDWVKCAVQTKVRGRSQYELNFVVNEDGDSRGMAGVLRITKEGDPRKLVFFHKGGSGTDWIEDYLPDQVELADGIAVQPKWNSGGTGWFSRPYSKSKLEHNLYGVTLRPAAVMKWVFTNVAKTPFATVGCSGGSIATYHPRHWHGLDMILKYQLFGGGPVMSQINFNCRGGGTFVGRCAFMPQIECNGDADCGVDGGVCSAYQWSSGAVMTAVRLSIDHLHLEMTGGTKGCFNKVPEFDFSESHLFSNRPADTHNEHPIDFLMNVSSQAEDDNGLSVLAGGALVYSQLSGSKSWQVERNGIHCDALNSNSGWQLLKSGAGM